jgi:hypothetical protein
MVISINKFLDLMLLQVKPNTAWQGENERVIVLKLWDRSGEIDWENDRIRCLSAPEAKRAEGAANWERRLAAVEEIRAGRKHGFFTIGIEDEVNGQRVYSGFSTEKLYKVKEIRQESNGELWVYFDHRDTLTPEQVRILGIKGAKKRPKVG